MKTNPKILFIITLLTGIIPLQAQETTFDPLGEETQQYLPRHVRIQVEYIEMSLPQMTALLAEPDANKSDTKLRARIDQLIQEKKATILETQMCIARSGEKATSESVREYTYPTEYEPSELLTTVQIEKGAEDKVPKKDFATGPTPTAFETRNLGSTLELEPTIDENNQVIDIRLSPALVYHVKNEIWST